jgi:hypothetical protein
VLQFMNALWRDVFSQVTIRPISADIITENRC